MDRAIKEIHDVMMGRQHQYELDRVHRLLWAFLELSPWVGLTGSGGQRCRFCWYLFPDHNDNCPYEGAKAYRKELEYNGY